VLRRLARLLVLSGLIGGLGAATAQADYTVHMCGGSPAAPWVEGYGAGIGFGNANDQCTSGTGYYYFNAGTATMSPFQPDDIIGAGITLPSGLVLTHIDATYSTLPVTSGSQAFLQIGYGNTLIVEELMGDANAGTHVSASVPNATDFYARVFCSTSASTGCTFASSYFLAPGALSLTLRDTMRPTVQATGGGLTAAGTYKGDQSLSYTASDTASGVDHVTIALGTTVLGTEQSTCQTSVLAPCPSTAGGAFDVDTTRVPDGTYPVILTAYDASGNATPTVVATVTIQNSTATQVLPPPTKAGSVHAKLEMRWHWTPARTVLTKVRLSKFARSATITVRCSGRRCPFKAKRGDGRHVRRFVKAMERRVFHSGQKLTVTIAQPRLVSERGQVIFRHNRKPLTRPL
jgi:hypothetical protein